MTKLCIDPEVEQHLLPAQQEGCLKPPVLAIFRGLQLFPGDFISVPIIGKGREQLAPGHTLECRLHFFHGERRIIRHGVRKRRRDCLGTFDRIRLGRAVAVVGVGRRC